MKKDKSAPKRSVGHPPTFTSVEQLQSLIDEYFESVPKCDIPTLSGLALSIGCDRGTILNYSKKSEYSSTIKRARDVCQEGLERTLVNRKSGSIVGLIFALKNNNGWEDKTEVSGIVEHTHFIGESINGAHKADNTRNRIFENAN